MGSSCICKSLVRQYRIPAKGRPRCVPGRLGPPGPLAGYCRRTPKRKSVMLAHCRAAAILSLTLAVLLAMPMPAASHPVSTPPGVNHGSECNHNGDLSPFDYCHVPSFDHMTFMTQFSLPGNAHTNLNTHFLGLMNGLPWAKDADHSDYQPNPAFTMVYTLRHVDRDVHDGDDDATPSGDAAAFSVTKKRWIPCALG